MRTNHIQDLMEARYRLPQYALMFEIGDSVHQADAFVLDCYRHVWHVFEIKTSRSDFLREMKNDQKREWFTRYCHYQWFVAPKGMINKDELPESWGLIEATKCKLFNTIKRFPKNSVEPMPLGLLGNMFRNTIKPPHTGTIKGIDKCLDRLDFYMPYLNPRGNKMRYFADESYQGAMSVLELMRKRINGIDTES